MVQKLAQKILSDGAKLSLEKYKLGDDVAKFLGRPAGSEEVVLVLETKWGGYTTAPNASWHLKETDLGRAYDIIRNEQDFRMIDTFLAKEINSIEDAKKLTNYLESVLKREE